MSAAEDRVPRTRDEYIRDLRDQVELLHNSAERYDRGSAAEAKSLALRLRVLLHEGRGRTRSLLGQLGVKDRLPYMDTAPAEPPPGVIQQHSGLCIVSATLGPQGSSRYSAPLGNLSTDRQHPPAAFVDWWDAPLVTAEGGTGFSRRMFVLLVADQDGGGHVDAELDAAYASLARDGLPAFRPVPSGDPRLTDLALPTVRQIAFELDRTLTEGLIEDPDSPFGFRVREPICSLSINTNVTTGRNDPCPCGSGRKMKACWGRRQPRRRITMDELVAEMGEDPRA